MGTSRLKLEAVDHLLQFEAGHVYKGPSKQVSFSYIIDLHLVSLASYYSIYGQKRVRPLAATYLNSLPAVSLMLQSPCAARLAAARLHRTQ